MSGDPDGRGLARFALDVIRDSLAGMSEHIGGVTDADHKALRSAHKLATDAARTLAQVLGEAPPTASHPGMAGVLEHPPEVPPPAPSARRRSPRPDIHKLRLALGGGDKPVSRAVLAQRIGATVSSVANWEAGRTLMSKKFALRCRGLAAGKQAAPKKVGAKRG